MRKERISDWSDLEVFTSKGAKIGKPYVTITAESAFCFNAGFIHQAKLKEYSHVVLCYSARKHAVVFNFTNDSQTAGALKLVQGTNINLGTRSFFNYYFLDPQKIEGRYIPRREKIPKIGEAWIIYLNEKQKEVGPIGISGTKV